MLMQYKKILTKLIERFYSTTHKCTVYIVHIILQIVQKVVDNNLTLELYCKHAFKILSKISIIMFLHIIPPKHTLRSEKKFRFFFSFSICYTYSKMLLLFKIPSKMVDQ